MPRVRGGRFPASNTGRSYPVGVSLVGDAVAADVLSSKTFSSKTAGIGITGTMTNQTGHVNAAGSSVSGTTLRLQPSAGFYPGDAGNSVQLTDADFVAASIKSGVDLFGIVGTFSQASIASLQSGTTTMNAATKNVTITAVTLNRTFVVVTNTGYGVGYGVRAQLTSTTNLQLTTSFGYSHTAKWFVVEISGATVQSGVGSTSGATIDITISAVTLAKTFAIYGGGYTGGGAYEEVYVTTELTSTTNLRLFRDSGAFSLNYAWFVIELP